MTVSIVGKVSEVDAEQLPIRSKAYVIDYWDTLLGVIMASLPSQILNTHTNQTEIVGVDVGVAWLVLRPVLWRKSDYMIKFTLAVDTWCFCCVWETQGRRAREEVKGRGKKRRKKVEMSGCLSCLVPVRCKPCMLPCSLIQ